MRALIQRVKYANVSIDSSIKKGINQGLLIFLGIEKEDNIDDIKWLVSKISKLRIFDDEDGVMNRSIVDINGQAMIISQFTLHAKTKKGNRPSYIHAAPPEISKPLYKNFIDLFSKEIKGDVVTGKFGADMQVELLNDGPVTIWIDTKNKE